MVVGVYPFSIIGDTHWLMYYLPQHHLVALRLDSGSGYFRANNHSYDWFPEQKGIAVPSELKQLLFSGVGAKQLELWSIAAVGHAGVLPIFLAAASSEELPLGTYFFQTESSSAVHYLDRCGGGVG